jgi:hypothetical protein
MHACRTKHETSQHKQMMALLGCDCLDLPDLIAGLQTAGWGELHVRQQQKSYATLG